MMLILTDANRTFLSFLIFGLINNVLYVVILTAAIDIVGSSTPKAAVLLADIIPALLVKLVSPFLIQLLLYKVRVWALVFLSTTGMLLVSTSSDSSSHSKLLGICMASLSSGLGEISFLQLTHYYNESLSIGGFSMGTGAAGLVGSFAFLLLTNILGMPSWRALLIFAFIPCALPVIFSALLPPIEYMAGYRTLSGDNSNQIPRHIHVRDSPQDFKSILALLKSHTGSTLQRMRPLFKPYMIPLCSVYVAEYTINQGVSPTLLFPLEDLPRWLFKSYRDLYVVYGFLYQFGVFLSRSSVTVGIRVRKLYLLNLLQTLNLGITVLQSLYDKPFTSIWPLMLLILYEGILGGLSYVNTFMSVSESIAKENREFSMACVGISDSLGIMLAGCINWWLEIHLCNLQVERGRGWCRGDSTE